MRQLLTLVAGDLMHRIRDKSVIIFAIGVPLGLMLALNLVIGGALDQKLATATVAISAPQGDPLSSALRSTLPGIGIDVRVTEADVEEVHALTESGDAKLGIIIPQGFTATALAGEPVEAQVIKGNGAGVESDVVIAVLGGFLDRVSASASAATAGGALGLPADQLAGITQSVISSPSTMTLVRGATAAEQLAPTAALVAGQAGLFLMFTVSFGVLSLIEERQNGTLARLYSMPMPRVLPVVAKALSSFVLGILATTILLVLGALLFDVSFGSPLTVGVLVACAVLATTALTFIVARLARTAEQASVIQTILAMVLGISGGAFMQIDASGAIGTLLSLNPVAALARGLGISSGGGGLGDIAGPVLVMLGFAAVAGIIARLVPDRGARA